MEEISKKELLAQTGISYGQLYRWKREGLLPEEWFVKRSAFTGQETFFPRDRILGRVRAILAMKDNSSLDEIRGQLAKTETMYRVREALLATINAGAEFVDSLESLNPMSSLGIEALATVVGLYEAATTAGLADKKLQSLTDEALRVAADCLPAPAQVALIEAQGHTHFVMMATTGQLRASAELTVLATVQTADVAERIRAQLPPALL